MLIKNPQKEKFCLFFSISLKNRYFEIAYTQERKFFRTRFKQQKWYINISHTTIFVFNIKAENNSKNNEFSRQFRVKGSAGK